MTLCYQVATPDVAIAPSVTAYQGPLRESFATLAALGYDGAELMTLDPARLDWDEVRDAARAHHLAIPLVCTGEVFGQLGLSFADPDERVREAAITRVCEIIDFAAHLGANINIGRVRGQYRDDIARDVTEQWAIEAFRRISGHAAPLGVQIALESVTIIQTNFINTIDEAARMVDRVGCDNFRLMMDVFHMNIEERDIRDTILRYKDYNIHVHLADKNRRYPGHCGMDIRTAIKAFYDAGYNGAFCTEIYQLPNQFTAVRGAITYLASLFHDIYKRPMR